MQEISAGELYKLVEGGESLLLIDVRQPEEFVYGTLKGAHLFPLSEINGRLAELEKLISDHKGQAIIYCRSGGRSEQVIRFLEARNACELTNLRGGTNEYSQFDATIERY